MPSLLDLANEVILQIGDHLELRQLLNLSSCNKYLYELAAEQRYASINLSDASRQPDGFHFKPLAFLQKIGSSPGVVAFPRKITIGPWTDVDTRRLNAPLGIKLHEFMMSKD